MRSVDCGHVPADQVGGRRFHPRQHRAGRTSPHSFATACTAAPRLTCANDADNAVAGGKLLGDDPKRPTESELVAIAARWYSLQYVQLIADGTAELRDLKLAHALENESSASPIVAAIQEWRSSLREGCLIEGPAWTLAKAMDAWQDRESGQATRRRRPESS